MTDESARDEQDTASSGPESGGVTGATEAGHEATDPGAGAAEAGSGGGEPEPDGSAPSRRGGMTVTDYERAMTERSQHARARGLDAPYIPGGEDPDPDATARAERPYIRLLVLMVAGIIIGAFALSIIGLIVLGNAAPA